MAARNGSRSTASSRSRDARTTASAWCVSASVSPRPGKCLTAAATPARCSPRRNATPSARHAGRVVAERADPDRGIRRGARHVEDRGVDDVHAHRPRLEPDGLADPLREIRVVGRADGHVAGELGRPVAERLELPALLVRGHQPGPVRVRATGRLERLGELADLARPTDVEVPEHRHPRGRRARRRSATQSGRRSPSNASITRPRTSAVGRGRPAATPSAPPLRRIRTGRHPLTAPARPRTK